MYVKRKCFTLLAGAMTRSFLVLATISMTDPRNSARCRRQWRGRLASGDVIRRDVAVVVQRLYIIQPLHIHGFMDIHGPGKTSSEPTQSEDHFWLTLCLDFGKTCVVARLKYRASRAARAD